MRYYKNLSPKERRRTILKAVAFSEAMENNKVAFSHCRKELKNWTIKSDFLLI
jgi:hypothetical protein